MNNKLQSFLYSLFLILLVSVFLDSCTMNPQSATCPPDIPLPKLTQDNACKTLMVIAEDRSGSNNDHNKFLEEDYKNIFTAFNTKTSGMVAVTVIGNPVPGEKDLHYFAFSSPYDSLPPLPAGVTIDELGPHRCKNKRISGMNDSVSAANATKISEYLEAIKKHVIGYKSNGKDLTDISTPVEHINRIINESVYGSYKNIIVLFLSDGQHDFSKSFKTDHPLLNTNRNIVLKTIGWKHPEAFSNISNKEDMESKESFINYLNNFNCN